MLQLLVIQPSCFHRGRSCWHRRSSCIAAVGLTCITATASRSQPSCCSCLWLLWLLLLKHLLLQLLLHKGQHGVCSLAL